MKKIGMSIIFLVGALCAQEAYLSDKEPLPDLKMSDNNLSFALIDGYQEYRIVSSHFRTDKNEIREILANPIAYNAMKKRVLPLPEGSKVVKIGWSVKKMENFPDALEADKLQRVEYMVKDSSRFNADGDHWGYARFVKKGDHYEAWSETQSCISCHVAAKENDYLFSKFHKKF